MGDADGTSNSLAEREDAVRGLADALTELGVPVELLRLTNPGWLTKDWIWGLRVDGHTVRTELERKIDGKRCWRFELLPEGMAPHETVDDDETVVFGYSTDLTATATAFRKWAYAGST